ncbi:DnaB-like helicase C-terminal domain-containing protein [Kitasatospora sp. MBT66]|uniref:DnaB-like helicase C-terminal domain-containing protein n=1 Tax=Kitasatospora sp. MBT66 TaxID=1444769 RepID=UPI0005BCD288|nr:DnaB-like helicase C-terminal domain-containing protein [Kitasatospora sp. MBT66]
MSQTTSEENRLGEVGPDAEQGVRTGLADLDELTGPLPPGRLVVVGGRASAGSTAFLVTTALNSALAGHAVAFVTTQVTDSQLRRNVLAALAGVNMDRSETVNAGRRARVRKAGQALDQVELHIWNPIQGTANTNTPDGIRRRIRHLNDRHPLGLVLIDDLALASYREETEGQTVHDFTRLARELDVPVLLAAHLRSEAGKDTVPPAVADFYDPHVLEAADAVILLHRPDRHGNAPSRAGQVDLLAAHGWPSNGTTAVRFEPEYHRFVDLPNS